MPTLARTLWGLLLSAFLLTPAWSQEYLPDLPRDHPAIRYTETASRDRAGRLAADLASGRLRWPTENGVRGYLPRLLADLEVGTESQMLVFSKTSLQAAHVSPSTPRAIYFNDDVAVAFVPGARSLEVASTDPVLGSVFYTLNVPEGGAPVLVRQQTCLQCHLGPNTAGVPGTYVGSVIPGPTGIPLRDESAIITDHRSAFEDRWGGWYVTARRGEQRDRANAVAVNPSDPAGLIRDSRQNLTSLLGLVDLKGYLAPTSDIVALIVYEHQTQVANLISRVNWQARIAAAANPGDDLTRGPVASDIDRLVDYMLFEGEAPIVEPIEGVSAFSQTFAARGPRDSRGRSLRDFDLKTRIFRFPLSYMIYSDAFDALPAPARARVYRRLYDRLSREQPTASGGLSSADRAAIVAIVGETKRELPAYWQVR